MRKPIARRARQTNISARQIVPIHWTYVVAIAICGCVLAAGFFLAARQHFESMEFGMKNSKLRKQLEDLESENRRLLLAREISFSPAEITKTARSMGFFETNGTTNVLALAAPVKTTKADKVIADGSRPSAYEATPASLRLTAYQRPAVGVPAGASVNAGVAPKQSKKSDPAKSKAAKPEITTIAKLR